MNQDCTDGIVRALSTISNVLDEMEVGAEYMALNSAYHKLENIISQ